MLFHGNSPARVFFFPLFVFFLFDSPSFGLDCIVSTSQHGLLGHKFRGVKLELRINSAMIQSIHYSKIGQERLNLIAHDCLWIINSERRREQCISISSSKKKKKEMKTLGPVSKQHSPFNIGSLVMPSSIQSLFKSQLISRNGARRWGQAMAGRGTKCAGILERH